MSRVPTPLPESIQALLAQEVPIPAENAYLKEAVRERLQATLAHGPVSPSTLTKLAHSKLVIGFGVLGLGAGMALLRLLPDAPPVTSPVAAERHLAFAEHPSPPLAPPGEVTLKPRPPTRASPAKKEEKPVATTLTEESALLELARARLAAGDGAGAQEALDEHVRRFPQGVLKEEREGLAVLALIFNGDRREAVNAAEAYARRYPHSVIVPVIREALNSKNE